MEKQEKKYFYYDSPYERFRSFRQKSAKYDPIYDIIAGVIFLIIAAIIFFIGQSQMDVALSLVNSNHAYYSPSAINKLYTDGFYTRLFGILFSFCGIFSLVYGFFRMQKQNNARVTESVNKRYCPTCGRQIPFDARICPYCGNNFENKM